MKPLTIQSFLYSTALIFVVISVVNCDHHKTANPPVVTDQDVCPAACANLSELKCEEAQPIDMKKPCVVKEDCLDVYKRPDPLQECTLGKCMTSCVSFCVNTESNGVWLQPKCVALAKTCDQARTCQ